MTRRKSLLLAFAAVAAAVSAVYASAYAWLAGEDDRADRRRWDALADQARLDLTAARLLTAPYVERQEAAIWRTDRAWAALPGPKDEHGVPLTPWDELPQQSVRAYQEAWAAERAADTAPAPEGWARLWTGAIAAMRTIHAEAHGGRPVPCYNPGRMQSAVDKRLLNVVGDWTGDTGPYAYTITTKAESMLDCLTRRRA